MSPGRGSGQQWYKEVKDMEFDSIMSIYAAFMRSREAKDDIEVTFEEVAEYEGSRGE